MLNITLADGEKAILNGAVIKSVGRTRLSIENKVSILRGREVMPPEEAITDARRLYFACMVAYIAPDDRAHQHEVILESLRTLLATLPGEDVRHACLDVARDLAHCDYYRALTPARTLIQLETQFLSRTAA